MAARIDPHRFRARDGEDGGGGELEPAVEVYVEAAVEAAVDVATARLRGRTGDRGL